MDVLYFTSQRVFPPNTGGTNVIFSFLKFFTKEANVEIVTPQCSFSDLPKDVTDGWNLIFLAKPNKFGQYGNPLVFWKMWRLIKAKRPKAIIFHFPWYGWFFVLCKLILHTKVYLHEQNVEYLRFKRIGRAWWPLLFWYEKHVCRLVDGVISITTIDRKVVLERFGVDPAKTIVAPYGFDTTRFQRDRQREDQVRESSCPNGERLILFFGALSYPPNLEALKVIEAKIAPSMKGEFPAVQIVVVGGPIPKRYKLGSDVSTINFIGHVENIKDYIYASDVVIVPLLSGSGIRTKIIEAIGCGKPVVSTAIGAEGIDPELCEGLLKIVANEDWQAFVIAIQNALFKAERSPSPVVAKFLSSYDGSVIARSVSLFVLERSDQK